MQVGFRRGGGFTVRSTYAKAADHPGSGLEAGFSRVYTQLRRSCYLCARVAPQKNFFESPFRGIHLARKTRLFPKPAEKCAMLLASAGQAAQPAKPLQEVDNMREDNGMNASELQELKAALLKAERLEILAILREADSLDDAIKAIEQRKNG